LVGHVALLRGLGERDLTLVAKPGLTPFEVKTVLAPIADNPWQPTPTHPRGPGGGR
jgi:hypothetical protein